MSEPRPRIWLLLGDRRGDNNQVLALGEALGLPFETRTLSYRPTWGVLLKLFPRGLSHLRSASRRWASGLLTLSNLLKVGLDWMSVEILRARR